MRARTGSDSGQPITLLLPGGGPLGVAYEAGALICLEDLFTGGFLQHVRAIIGSSAGAVTGAFLTMGLAPQSLVKSLSGRFPDEIEYFDPSILLQFDRHQVPSPFLGLWRSMRFLLAELGRDPDREAPLDERRERCERYLSRIEDIINLVPKGWFSLNGLEKFLRRNLANRDGQLYDFDRFATDLFVCATDLNDGHAVLFGKQRFEGQVKSNPFFSKHDYVTGASLAHAVVSSSAIPFLFVPYRDRQMILADGDTRNPSAVGMARSLVDARFMIAINPLVPLHNVKRDCTTAELFLQALLTALEGNIVATLKMEFEEKYRRERSGEDTFDIVYFRPSAADMAAMTDSSIINLFRYKPLNVLMGYRSVFETVRDHPEESQTILRRYGYECDVAIATRRYALMQHRRTDPEALEDVILAPAHAIGPVE